MKSSIINKKTIFLKILIIVINIHLVISLFRYINYQYRIFNSFKKDLKKYIKENSKELKKGVFIKLFKEAKECNFLKTSELKIDCYKKITHNLAEIIKEENFLSWPHDLFFVKKINNHYYILDWDGNLKNISVVFNKKIINKNESKFVDFLLKKCNYFGTADYPSESCEVFISINLNNYEKGYIVRKMPLLKDNYFIYYFLSPFLIFLGIITSFSLPNDFFYYKELFWSFIPFIIGFFIYFFLTKFNKKNNKI